MPAETPSAPGTQSTLLSAWSIHDLRRTVATGLQRPGIRLEVTEAMLNHISGSRSGSKLGSIQRHDWASEKRVALEAWGAHVLAAADRRTPANNILKLVQTS